MEELSNQNGENTENTPAEVKFTYLNNDSGGGFPAVKTVDDGTTIEEFLEDENVDTTRFQIRVRTKAEDGAKQTLTPVADYVIKSGDYVTCVPIKSGGAR